MCERKYVWKSEFLSGHQGKENKAERKREMKIGKGSILTFHAIGCITYSTGDLQLKGKCGVRCLRYSSIRLCPFMVTILQRQRLPYQNIIFGVFLASPIVSRRCLHISNESVLKIQFFGKKNDGYSY